MLFNLDEIPQVPMPKMNLVHREEVEMVNEIYEIITKSNCDLEALQEKLKFFMFHVHEHFENEEIMMMETNCPVLGCHRDEHNRVKMIMIKVFKYFVDHKDLDHLIGYFENEFKPWISDHIKTMDTVTALYLDGHAKGVDLFSSSNS